MALRIIAPSKVESTGLIAQLGPVQETESKPIVLDSGQLTTDQIAKNIREYARLRDESSHTLRLLTIDRKPKNASVVPTEFASRLQQYWKELDQTRGQYRDLQSTAEKLERQMDGSIKKIGVLRQLVDTGFGLNELKETKDYGLTRILGRVPTRRLQDVHRALLSSMKDQAFIATGKQKGDWTHLLVAVPSEKATAALQTLVLHDFTTIDVPEMKQPDLEAALIRETEQMESAKASLDGVKTQLKTFANEASENLNDLMDNTLESLIYLRAVLRIGEGAKAQQAFIVLARAPPVKALDALTRAGALVESE